MGVHACVWVFVCVKELCMIDCGERKSDFIVCEIKKGVNVCMCVCFIWVYVRVRERKSDCSVCVCVCVCERERETVRMAVGRCRKIV